MREVCGFAVMTRKTKNTFAFFGCINIGIVALIILFMAVPAQNPSSEKKVPAEVSKEKPTEKTPLPEQTINKEFVSPSPTGVVLGKLSTDEEEKLRLKDFKGFLRYKSQVDGTRDRELLGLSSEERQQVINQRVQAKILKTIATRPTTPAS